jgi:ribonuclease R
VYCEPIAGRRKRWRLIVAIADVSHYVETGNAIDAEAQTRSTSVYFPRRVIPMLPEKLCNGLCSLNPQLDRLVMVADCVIGPRGTIDGYQFYPAVMHSHARLTYEQVWEALSIPGSRAAVQLEHLLPELRNLYALYEVLAASREERGAIDLDTTETCIVCDPNGRIEKIVPRVRNDAHKIIEECMLAANVCAADVLRRHKQPALFRVHEGPTPERLANLRTMLKSLGLTLEGGDDPTPADYSHLLKKVRSRPDSQLLQTVLLRSMQQAVYSPELRGHFGLAFEAYAHFTSPIRRYPDLLVHRAIKAILAGRTYVPVLAGGAEAAVPPRGNRGGTRPAVAAKPPSAATGAVPVWEKLGLLCSANERRADDASRDVEAWLKSYYMRERVGETFGGTVSAVVPFGVFVLLDDLFVEGLVHVSELGSEYFLFSEPLHELRGERTGMRYRLGDRLTVQVARVDLEARRIEFRLVRADTRRSILAAAIPAPKADRKRGESSDERKARQARIAERRTARATSERGVGLRGRKREARRQRS